jgi:hypothetical protein
MNEEITNFSLYLFSPSLSLPPLLLLLLRNESFVHILAIIRSHCIVEGEENKYKMKIIPLSIVGNSGINSDTTERSPSFLWLHCSSFILFLHFPSHSTNLVW